MINKGAVSQALAPTVLTGRGQSTAADASAIQRARNALKRLRDKRWPCEDCCYYRDERKTTCLLSLKSQVKYNQHNT